MLNESLKARLMRSVFHVFVPVSLVCLAACGDGGSVEPSTRYEGDVQSFAADNRAGNLFLGFTGDDTGIPGVNRDLANVAKLFANPALELNFGVRTFNKQTVSQIVSESSKGAKDMLESPGATMFWYMSSHGAENGATLARDKTFFFSQVAAGIRRARGEKPLQRLIVFFDTCFSGQNVDGTQRIDNDSGAIKNATIKTADQIAAAARAANTETGLARQFIVMGASRRNQTSGDTPDGGVGSLALIKAVQSLSSQKIGPDGKCVTIKDWFNTLKRNAAGQEPVVRFEPESVANECFFDELPAIAEQ